MEISKPAWVDSLEREAEREVEEDWLRERRGRQRLAELRKQHGAEAAGSVWNQWLNGDGNELAVQNANPHPRLGSSTDTSSLPTKYTSDSIDALDDGDGKVDEPGCSIC